MNTTDYIGNELELFFLAENWKNYWSDQVKDYLGQNIIEVGAGLGGTTKLLLPKAKNCEKWIALEPDPKLANQIESNIADCEGREKVKVEVNFLKDLAEPEKADSILYIDVIEHIENDKLELETALERLEVGGYLIILVPAHNFLFSPFDKAIGHFRRYNMPLLHAALPENLEIVVNRYLDTLGLMLSLGNKLLLKQSYPTEKQILFWDRFVVPPSKIMDKISFHKLGKSILFIGRKTH